MKESPHQAASASSKGSGPDEQLARDRDRFKLLLEINNAVVSHLSLDALLHAISPSLQRVLPHDSSTIALYDEDSGQLRSHVLEYSGEMPYFVRGGTIPLEGTTSGEAFVSGQPAFVDESNLERFLKSEFFRKGYDAGLRSGGNVPLIAHGRKLGVLGVASFRENAFSKDDIQLLSQIASQIAIAVENALNYEKSQETKRALGRSLDRLNLLLDVTNKVTLHLDLPDLFKAISDCMTKAIDCDAVGVTIFDAESGLLRIRSLTPLSPVPLPAEGALIPIEGTPAGLAFTTLQTQMIDRDYLERSQSPLVQRAFADGLRSGCVAPLISHGRALGTLAMMSIRENAFTREDAELITQIAKQVALAVENAQTYGELAQIKNKLAEEKLYLEEEIKTAYNFEQIIGSSPALTRILKQVETVAPTDSTVLIQGETGTGKELIARAIHNLSTRSARTLVKLNCAAIPTGLLESELFGHEKGAFTGAIAQRVGRFELAHKGSLFLDEVGEIPLDLQPKLLRVIQEQEFERLGSTRTMRVDVRLIAATNRNLAQRVSERQFRDDLYYRLNVFPITIPPLRERREDIPLLARFFASRAARRMKKRIDTISAVTMASLQSYHWPGNIRELENLIERATILTQGTELEISPGELKTQASVAVFSGPQPASSERLQAAPASTQPSGEPDSLQNVERDHIHRILNETNWVVSGPNGAAARLGMKRTTLQARIKKLGIKR